MWSVSVACILLSAVAIYSYHYGLTKFLYFKYGMQEGGLFVGKVVKIDLIDKEKRMVAISSLIILFFILEIVLAATILRSTTVASNLPQPEYEVGTKRMIEYV